MENLKRIEVFDEYYSSDVSSKLDEVIAQYKAALRSITIDSHDDEMSVLLCNSICNSFDIKNSVVSVCGPKDYHFVLALELNDKYYILDTNYKKYLKNSNFKVHKNNMNEKFRGLPGFFMLNSTSGRNFVNELISKKYFECTEENMKLYCDSFVLARYNQNKKFKNLVYTTNITGQEYLTSMILKRMIDSKGYQKIIGGHSTCLKKIMKIK